MGISVLSEDCPDLTAVGADEAPTVCADQITADANITLTVTPAQPSADDHSVNITLRNTGSETKYTSGDGWVLYKQNDGWHPVAGGGVNGSAYVIGPGEIDTYELTVRPGDSVPNGWHGSRYNETTGRYLSPGKYAFVIEVFTPPSAAENGSTNYLIKFEVSAE